jgi:hypothetical protein
VAREAGPSRNKRIDRAYQLALGRLPDPAERKAALKFLKDSPLGEFTLAVFLVNDFLYVN